MVRGGLDGELADVVPGVLVAEAALGGVRDVGVAGPVERPKASGVRVAGGRVLDAGEEPQPVLDDVAAEGRADVANVGELPVGGNGQVLHRNLRRVAGQPAGGPGAEDRAVELVTSGLGDRADRATGGPAVLGHVATGDHVHLVDELGSQRGAVHAVGGVVGGKTVDQVEL